LDIKKKISKLKDKAGLVTYKECQIPEQLRYLNVILLPKDHKEDPSTDGRIMSNRTFAK